MRPRSAFTNAQQATLMRRRIEVLMAIRDMTHGEAASAIGVHRVHFSRMLHGHGAFQPSVIAKLVELFGQDITQPIKVTI